MILENLSATKGKLQQVFLYITGRCNAYCTVCYLYGNYYGHKHMPLFAAINYLKKYREMGAYQVTFLGGEPTLHPELGQIIAEAKSIGYKYLRLTTNGQFNPDILYDKNIQNLNTITFSIDGPTNEVNSRLRRGIDLEQIIHNMQVARKFGHDIRVNTTITSVNIDSIKDLIYLSLINGATQINLNIVFLKGGAASHPELIVDPEHWLQVYKDISTAYTKYPIEIKIPLGYTKKTQRNKKKYRCLAREGSRLYVMPDGNAYPCLLLINSHFFGMPQNTDIKICNNKGLYSFCPLLPIIGEYLPLCIYLKQRLNPQGDKSKEVILHEE